MKKHILYAFKSKIIKILTLENNDFIQKWIENNIVIVSEENEHKYQKFAFYELIKILSSDYILESDDSYSTYQKFKNLWQVIDGVNVKISSKEQGQKFQNNIFRALAYSLIESQEYVNLNTKCYSEILNLLHHRYEECNGVSSDLFDRAKNIFFEQDVNLLGEAST